MTSKKSTKQPAKNVRRTPISPVRTGSRRPRRRGVPSIVANNRFFVAIFILVFGLLGSYLLWHSFADQPVAPTEVQYAPGTVLMKFKENVPQAVQDKLLARYSASVSDTIPQVGVKVLTVPVQARDAVVAALSHNPAVKFAEKDALLPPATTMPNDPYYYGSPPAPYAGNSAQQIYQWPFSMTQTNQVWDTTLGSPSTVVAVLDTGFTPGLADDGTFVSNWSVSRNSTDVSPVYIHGDYVAGVINARTNNGVGVASTCGNCAVMGVQVTTDSGGSAASSDLAKGMTYAADHGAKLMNISFAGTSSSSTEQTAEQYALGKGMLLFAAAGNNSSSTPAYPAADPGVIGVAALGSDNSFYTYSNHGSWVPIAAPTTVYTTLPNGAYGAVGGTSIASPFAAGAAALVWSAVPQATAAQIKQAIFSNTDPVTGGPSGYSVQYGRINPYKMLQALRAGSTTPAADTTPPAAVVSNPANGATVSGATSVNVTASDNTGVARVELYRGTTLIASTPTAPYSFYWDTTTVANGTYSLTAKAYDAAGNVGTSAAISVTVNNQVADTTPPLANLTAPTANATVSGTVNVAASATDNAGVTSSELYIDGVLRASSTNGSLSFSWNTLNETNGLHTLQTKAYDAAGNVGSSSLITVTISNQGDKVAPVVTITQPGNGSVITNSLTVTATATDNTGVTRLEIYLDNALKATTTSGNYTTKLNTRKLASGTHTIMVKAYDAAGNVGSSSVSVVK
ncbi:MAG TPA: Ig-like domain-containing protein [Candidatus Microsaccharimonas sp.]|nr:Ig-like domain-containing protein [Candidatus Microsaccharimonas sp.]